MRHFYFRLVMGFVFLVCFVFSAITVNTMGIIMGSAMFYGAYTEWKRIGGGRS